MNRASDADGTAPIHRRDRPMITQVLIRSNTGVMSEILLRLLALQKTPYLAANQIAALLMVFACTAGTSRDRQRRCSDIGHVSKNVDVGQDHASLWSRTRSSRPRARRRAGRAARIVRLTASLNGMPCSHALLQKPREVVVDAAQEGMIERVVVGRHPVGRGDGPQRAGLVAGTAVTVRTGSSTGEGLPDLFVRPCPCGSRRDRRRRPGAGGRIAIIFASCSNTSAGHHRIPDSRFTFKERSRHRSSKSPRRYRASGSRVPSPPRRRNSRPD